MADPSDLHARENWSGGSYDLAIELGSSDDASVEQILAAVWRAARIKGAFLRDEAKQRRHVPTRLTVKSLERGHLNGVVRLPSGRDIVCGVWRMTEEEGHDWLVFYLPLGALAGVDRRIGSFPLGDDGGPRSLAWRQVLDVWLADIAKDVYRQVRFKLALVGWDPTGEMHADALAGEAPAERLWAFLLPTPDGLRYYAATK